MNGAESLIQTLVDSGLDVCFANPGTTEMPMVRALDEREGVRAVLCLFEGVCTGAADGYARMSEKPGVTLLHLGPGFANGIAYLHDARRARSPIVNLIGDHATWHLPADPPLASDIESLARPVSAWIRKSRSGEDLSADLAEAISTAWVKPGRISTLILPHDYQMQTVEGPIVTPDPAAAPLAPEEAIAGAAKILRLGDKVALFLGGHALRARGLNAVARIASVANCNLVCESFPARWERGTGAPVIERLPYFPEPAMAMLSPYKTILLAGARPPVSFFGYPGIPSYFISPQTQALTLASPDEDVADALERLAESLGAPAWVEPNSICQAAPLPEGKLTPETLSATIAAMLPEHAIVMDESNTSMGPFSAMSQSAARHTVLMQPGGAIGLGPPCATGAAVACPNRVVINLQADGSAMYTVQAFWTQAREKLNVKTIICNNRSYRILGIEMMRAGVTQLGRQAQRMVSLAGPEIDWVSLAGALGVPAVRVHTAQELAQAFQQSLGVAGPELIDAVLA